MQQSCLNIRMQEKKSKFVAVDTIDKTEFYGNTLLELAMQLGLGIISDAVARLRWCILHETLLSERYQIQEFKKKRNPAPKKVKKAKQYKKKSKDLDKRVYEDGIDITNLNKGYISPYED